MLDYRFKALREYIDVSSGLWIILLEAGLALALLLGFVWWTLPRKPRSTEKPGGTRKDSPRPR
jgi:hypothetical protein